MTWVGAQRARVGRKVKTHTMCVHRKRRGEGVSIGMEEAGKPPGRGSPLARRGEKAKAMEGNICGQLGVDIFGSY